VVVDKKTKKVICTAFANGKRHDFRLFKESKTRMHPAGKASYASSAYTNPAKMLIIALNKITILIFSSKKNFIKSNIDGLVKKVKVIYHDIL